MDSPQRKIVAAMAVTAIFAAVGEYANPQNHKPPDPFKVILGASLATAMLVGIAEFGQGGERLGVGLSAIAVLSATLVYGGPVWKTLSNAVSKAGTKPTTPTSGSAAAPAGAGGDYTRTQQPAFMGPLPSN